MGPPSSVELAARLQQPRMVRLIAEPHHRLGLELQRALQDCSPSLQFVDTIDAASHVLVLLTGGILSNHSCQGELQYAADVARTRTVFVYSVEGGWDFGTFYARPDDIVKESIASHEALTYRRAGGYEFR